MGGFKDTWFFLFVGVIMLVFSDLFMRSPNAPSLFDWKFQMPPGPRDWYSADGYRLRVIGIVFALLGLFGQIIFLLSKLTN